MPPARALACGSGRPAGLLGQAGTVLRAAGRAALDLVLPPQCLTCDAPVEAPGLLCPDCFRATSFVTAPFCARCGVPFAHAGQGQDQRQDQGRSPTDGAGAICPGCAANPPPWDRARAALRYDSQARRMVLPLKYGDREELAPHLAARMARVGAGLLADAEVLVPVPLHRGRLFSRRYNQAALLARALSRLSGRPTLLDALRRTRATAPLGRLSAAERAAALAGAIAVRPGREAAIAGRRVLLVDDVMTSGATAGACARALLAGGAAAVDVLAAARVPDPRLDGSVSDAAFAGSVAAGPDD